jgi:pyridoxamine 5'-phosphate oxidase
VAADRTTVDDERRLLEARGLDRDDLDPDPLVVLSRWFDHAVEVGVHQPEAMTVASATPAGEPSVRFVLCKGYDERGVVFYTNEHSRKGAELRANPVAAALFPWHQISRQVRIVGAVVRVGDDEADAYFASRPRGSQIGAWASPQSEVLADRADLEARWAAEERRWQGRDVARPEHWGGFRIVPDEWELWQGRANRLHDRFRYTRAAPTDPWQIDRLAP